MLDSYLLWVDIFNRRSYLYLNGVKKGNRILRYGCRAFDTFWVPDDIESCNFQNLLIFGFHETSQNLMSFRQLLFSLFHGGDQRKKSENPRKVSNVWHPYLRILFPFILATAGKSCKTNLVFAKSKKYCSALGYSTLFDMT